MSRSGYSEDADNVWALIRWRGAVASSIRGRRGQAFLRELIDALDAMPIKRLISGELAIEYVGGGEVCALGSLGVKRGTDLKALDPEDYEAVAATFGVAGALIQEITYENDEAGSYYNDGPEKRWQRMRDWARRHLKPSTLGGEG